MKKSTAKIIALSFLCLVINIVLIYFLKLLDNIGIILGILAAQMLTGLFLLSKYKEISLGLIFGTAIIGIGIVILTLLLSGVH
ncbi:MAG: hypothetical protein H6598_10170 [Flavobacteriales bacterium]|nr:hypothetical protein [Flavobacteriales bacterium]